MSKQKQENILQFIENYIMEYKIAPSVREICDG
ncbi:MAG: transcriptional regulator, partial [Oscillospiraceae bacterium]|nr:transcriptional regulator [Oscillospiraceae bacterium]